MPEDAATPTASPAAPPAASSWSDAAARPTPRTGGGDRGPAVVVGIAGGSGSGKTSVVDKVLRDVGPDRIAVLRHDRYYHDLGHLPQAERLAVNVDHPDAFDDDLFLDHVRALVAGRRVESPRYDYATYRRLPGHDVVEPRPVVLVEGILVFASPRIRDLLDVKVYVDAAADLRLVRRLRRDVVDRGRTVADVLDQYESTVRPMHLEFVEPSKRFADVIVPRGARNEVGVGMVTARVRSLLRGF